MAAYTPAAVIPVTALTITGGTSLLTGTTGVVYVIRTLHVEANSSGKTFNFSIGADAVGTRLFDTYSLGANVPSIFNGWWVTTGAGAAHTFDGSISATTGNIYAGGYTYA